MTRWSLGSLITHASFRATTRCRCQFDALLRHRLQRSAKPPGNLPVRQRAQEGDLFHSPSVPSRIRDAQFLTLLPHGLRRPTRLPCQLLIDQQTGPAASQVEGASGVRAAPLGCGVSSLIVGVGATMMDERCRTGPSRLMQNRPKGECWHRLPRRWRRSFRQRTHLTVVLKRNVTNDEGQGRSPKPTER